MSEPLESSEFLVVLTSTPTENEALRIIQLLLEAKVIASGKVLPGAVSRYWWQGQIEEAREWVVLLKTRRGRFPAVQDVIHRVHSYRVPEIIALPIVDGAPSYLAWLRDAVAP